MTITQFIQSSPANANELFAKLAATSSGAVKSRESLFNELKTELDLHSRLEEEHLFPVLRKHKETKELVRAAVDDNKQTRALLSELAEMPKDGEEFLAKLSELRKAFQQHVRDEKKELLPAVKTALSDAEAQTITEKVEADKAALDEQKRQEAEERRAAARQEREKADRRRAQAEARKQRAQEEEKRQRAEVRAEQRQAREEEMRQQAEAEAERQRAREAGAALAHMGESLVRGGQTVATAGHQAALAGTEATISGSQEMGGFVSEALGQAGAIVAGAVQTYSDQAGPALDRLQALASLPPAVAGAAAETGKTWFDLMSRAAQSRGRQSFDLLRCLTPLQAAQVQTRYVSESMQALLEANIKTLEISVEAYGGIARRRERTSDARPTA